MTDAQSLSPAQPDADLEASTPPPLFSIARPALFLDFDGTLVDIAERPDAVQVGAALPALIASLAEWLDGRLAIVSGRTLAVLSELLGPIEVAMAGSHGGEFRSTPGAEMIPLAEPLPRDVVEALGTFARDNGGLLVEPKPFSIAVHYRRHPHVLDALLEQTTAIASARGLGLKHGKQVIELTMPGSDKGSAVARFMDLPAFAGARPLFVGDDVTDEDAFHVVEHLGGAGILVGEPRQTAARWRLPDVPAVHRWLASTAARQEKGDAQA